MLFASLRGCNMNFLTVFGHAAAWFLAATTTWVRFHSWKSKNGGKIQIIVCETSKMYLFQNFFLDFKLWRLAISKPVDLGKSYVHQKKALYYSKWMKFWDWKDLCHESWED